MAEGAFREIVEVDTVQYKTSKGGKPYLLFTSGKTKYYMWGLTPEAKEIPDGATCEIEYAVSDEGYNNIVDIKIVSGPSPLQPKQAKGEFRTPLQLIRSDCLACAVGPAKARIEQGEDFKSSQVVKVAEEFEAWILR